MFTVRQLREKIIGKNEKMVMVCVDLEKAYDEVDGSVMVSFELFYLWMI